MDLDSTTEPVRRAALIGAAIKMVLPAAFTVLGLFHIWEPSTEQIAGLAGLYTAFLAAVTYVQTEWSRGRVTPVAANAVELARQESATVTVRALARNDVPAAVAAQIGSTVHDLRYANGEPVVAPPPNAGMTPPPAPPKP